MKRKVLITLIILGILLFGIITLHILSAFYSFTLRLKEEQYKAILSDAILILALIFALFPLLQSSKKTLKLEEAQYKSLVSDVISVLIFCFAFVPLLEASRNKTKLRQAGSKTLIMGNRCFRCGHEWRPKNIEMTSSVCPNCYSPYWNRPRIKHSIQG